MEERYAPLPIAVVQRVASATITQLLEWTIRFLTTSTLTEMFD